MTDLMTESAAETWLAISTDSRVMVPADTFPAEDLDALRESGLVSTCSWAGSEVATLTPLSASRLGLRIGPKLTWVDASIRPKRKKPKRDAETSLDPSRLADERADRPDEIAMANERIEAEAQRQDRRRTFRRTDAEVAGRELPYPSTLLQGCRAWERIAPRPCPACLGKKLHASTYCLICDRWGLDWLLARLTPIVQKKACKPAAFRPKRKKVVA